MTDHAYNTIGDPLADYDPDGALPPIRCNAKPSYRGWRGCTRRKGHEGPCCVPLSWWGRIKYWRRFR